jgi:hypothetical protein
LPGPTAWRIADAQVAVREEWNGQCEHGDRIAGLNQRAVLKNRAALVDELYTKPLSSRVIAIES